MTALNPNQLVKQIEEIRHTYKGEKSVMDAIEAIKKLDPDGITYAKHAGFYKSKANNLSRLIAAKKVAPDMKSIEQMKSIRDHWDEIANALHQVSIIARHAKV